MARKTPEQFQEDSDELYCDKKRSSLLPADYDISNRQNIDTFGKRLRQSRRDYNIRTQDVLRPSSMRDVPDKPGISQGALAKYVGVCAMEISKYETGKIEKIPLKNLQRICDFLDVTPHYLLGLVSEPDKMLSIAKDGTIKKVKKKEVEDIGGNKKEVETEVDEVLMSPMQFDPTLCVKAAESYRALFYEDSDLYWLINDLICSPIPLRKYYKQILADAMRDQAIR